MLSPAETCRLLVSLAVVWVTAPGCAALGDGLGSHGDPFTNAPEPGPPDLDHCASDLDCMPGQSCRWEDDEERGRCVSK